MAHDLLPGYSLSGKEISAQSHYRESKSSICLVSPYSPALCHGHPIPVLPIFKVQLDRVLDNLIQAPLPTKCWSG